MIGTIVLNLINLNLATIVNKVARLFLHKIKFKLVRYSFRVFYESSLKKSVEELLNILAGKIVGYPFASSQIVKTELSKVELPIFYKGLNKWLDNGEGFFETF